MVIGLTVLFAGICVVVFLSKSKSKKWVARKMKIGGLLLTLTAASCNGGGGEVMCYETVANNYIWLENQGENGIELKLDTGNVLNGHIIGAQDSAYSYRVMDESEKIVRFGELIPNDGKFDQSDESFKIELDKNLSPGNYSLDLFPASTEMQDSSYIASHINLIIKGE